MWTVSGKLNCLLNLVEFSPIYIILTKEKRMKRITMLLSVIFVLGMVLAACAPAATPAAAPTVAPEATKPVISTEKPYRVALILPGRADDVSWNQSAFEGLTWAKENAGFPVEIKVVEQVYDVADIEPALRDYAQQG